MAIYTGKDANRPKRPQSAYFLWLADFRAQMKDKFVENRDILRAGKYIKGVSDITSYRQMKQAYCL